MAQTSNTGNPTGGTGGGLNPAMPQTLKIKSMADAFMNESGYEVSILNPVGITPNGTINFNLLNTGLVDKLILSVSGTVPLKNAAGSAQVVQFAPEFPYNIINQINVTYNGSVSIVNASPYELLALSAKRNKHVIKHNSFGATYTQSQNRVSPKRASVTAGAGGTLQTGNSLTGYTGVSIAANSTCTISFTLNIEIPFTLRTDLPIGLIALQNNSLICQVNVTSPALLGTTPANPFYVASAVPSTLTLDPALTTAITGQPVQYYWSTPANKNLYGYFVSNSYMNISIPSQSFKNTGNQAFQYQLQNNFLLLGMLFTIRDSGNNLIDVPSKTNNFFLNYNNTTSVDRQPQIVKEFLQDQYYEGSPTSQGQLLWDATIHEYLSNGLVDTSVLDMYRATSPQFFMDIDSTVSAPGTFSAMREIIVPAQIRQN
jgi:hypothetical protein